MDLFPTSSDPALIGALNSIAEEERRLLKQLMEIQERLVRIGKAKQAMEELVGVSGPPAVQVLDSAPANSVWRLAQPGLRPTLVALSDMPFAKALSVFMDTLHQPLPVREITERFERAGFRFSNNDLGAKTNQVGVTLRRGEGEQFFRSREDRDCWMSVGSLAMKVHPHMRPRARDE